MATRFETEYDNVEFSFVVKRQNFVCTFEWGDKTAKLPWHQDLFKVSIRVYDTKLQNKGIRSNFYFPCADWITPKEVRDCAMQMIYNYVEFPKTIGSEKENKKFGKSAFAITKKTRDFMVGLYDGTIKEFE